MMHPGCRHHVGLGLCTAFVPHRELGSRMVAFKGWEERGNGRDVIAPSLRGYSGVLSSGLPFVFVSES